MIECTELAEILKKMDMEVNEEDLEHIISEVDYYNNKKINYSDFLSATVPIRTFMTEHRLQAIFQQFDTDNSGQITHENIEYAMQKLGHNLTEEQIDEMIKQHDVKGDGVLSYEEFVQIFSNKVDDGNEQWKA